MYTSCTTVHMIKSHTGCISISTLRVVLEEQGVSDRQQRREKSNIWWQTTWVGGLLTIAPVMLIWARPGYSASVCRARCDCLCWALRPTIWTSRSIIFQKNSLHFGVPSKRQAKWESPSVRCYKLLARPAARPREPDLAAPRLRRVKRCTQRSSLHLYAPYIGRLLLQPTGTWLLAS